MGKKKSIDEKPVIRTSRLYDGKDLLEQGYDKESNQTYYIRWNFEEETYTLQKYLETNDTIYSPIKDDLLEKEAVILSKEPMEYGTEEDLEIDIEAFIESWLDISDEHRQKATWYIMLSWIIDNLHTIPYLRALGDYGTGKTRYLDVIGGLCYKPMYVGGSVRSAPIYRVIDFWRGTAIFDEFTLGKSDDTEDIIQILNNGYQRGKPVLRCKDGNYDEVKAFDPFCAKILATKKMFTDKALESRCITEILKTTPRGNIPIDLSATFFRMRSELQNKLLMFRFRNLHRMQWDETTNIDFGKVLPRVKQALTPFTILFQYNNDRLNGFIEYVKDYNKNLVDENSNSFDGQLVNAYFALVQKHNETQDTLDDFHPCHISSTDIKNFLIEDGWKEGSVNSRTVGRHLKTLGFETKHIRIHNKIIKILTLNKRIEEMLRLKYIVNDCYESYGT